MKCWGAGANGSTGHGHTNDIGDDPNKMGDLLTESSLSTGGERVLKVERVSSGATCALLSDHNLRCWGSGGSGFLGVGSTTNRGNSPSHMGENLPNMDLGTDRKVMDFTLALWAGCAILDNGSTKCWGINTYGQLGLGDTLHRGDDAGEMGDNLPAIDFGSNLVAMELALGSSHSCAILGGGGSRCWGFNNYGQLGQGSTATQIESPLGLNDIDWGANLFPIKLMTSFHSTCGLLSDGKVKCFGSNISGSLGRGTSPTAAIGDDPSEMGSNLPYVNLGTLYALDIGGKASVGSYCITATDASLRCWGDNYTGRLGVGVTGDRGDAPGELGASLLPTSLGTNLSVVELGSHTGNQCALLTNGRVKCFGTHLYGGLGAVASQSIGDGAGEMGDNLAFVDFGTDLYARSLSNAGCVIVTNGFLKCWGNNGNGGLGLGHSQNIGDHAGEMGDNLPYVDLNY